MYSFPDLESVCCSMSGPDCCFLTCMQISQEAGQVVWYSHLFKNFPQFVVIHTVKGFGIVNKAEVDVFLELSSFFDDRPCQCGYKSSYSHIASRIFHHYRSVPGFVAKCGCCICSVGRYEVFLCIYPCTKVG